MTEITSITYYNYNDPDLEVVTGTGSHGSTYVSRKFGTVDTANIYLNDGGAATAISCSISGATVTIVSGGFSARAVKIELRGRK